MNVYITLAIGWPKSNDISKLIYTFLTTMLERLCSNDFAPSVILKHFK